MTANCCRHTYPACRWRWAAAMAWRLEIGRANLEGGGGSAAGRRGCRAGDVRAGGAAGAGTGLQAGRHPLDRRAGRGRGLPGVQRGRRLRGDGLPARGPRRDRLPDLRLGRAPAQPGPGHRPSQAPPPPAGRSARSPASSPGWPTSPPKTESASPPNRAPARSGTPRTTAATCRRWSSRWRSPATGSGCAAGPSPVVPATTTKPGLRRLPRRTKTGLLRTGHSAIKREAHLDGKWLLRTSDLTQMGCVSPPDDLAAAYNPLIAVERGRGGLTADLAWAGKARHPHVAGSGRFGSTLRGSTLRTTHWRIPTRLVCWNP